MIAEALCKAFPDQEWTLRNGAGYEGLVWHGPGEKPTEKQFDDAIASYEPEPVQSRLDLVISALEKKGVLSKDDVRQK